MTDSAANVGSEARLWQTSDALRGSIGAAEFKPVVLGPIFLRSSSAAFVEQHATLLAEKKQGANPEQAETLCREAA